MGHVYTFGMENTTVVGSATLAIIHAAAALTTRASVLEILRVEVSQRGTATSEQAGLQLGQKASAFGTYTSATPRPHVIGGAASGISGGTAGAAATCGVDASAEGAGTFTEIIPANFNNLNGYIWIPTERERILVMPDTAFAVKLTYTPADLDGWTTLVTFEELN